MSEVVGYVVYAAVIGAISMSAAKAVRQLCYNGAAQKHKSEVIELKWNEKKQMYC